MRSEALPNSWGSLAPTNSPGRPGQPSPAVNQCHDVFMHRSVEAVAGALLMGVGVLSQHPLSWLAMVAGCSPRRGRFPFSLSSTTAPLTLHLASCRRYRAAAPRPSGMMLDARSASIRRRQRGPRCRARGHRRRIVILTLLGQQCPSNQRSWRPSGRRRSSAT